MASNPTLSQIKVGNVVYDICDTTARKAIANNTKIITTAANVNDALSGMKISFNNDNFNFYRVNSVVIGSYYGSISTTVTPFTRTASPLIEIPNGFKVFGKNISQPPYLNTWGGSSFRSDSYFHWKADATTTSTPSIPSNINFYCHLTTTSANNVSSSLVWFTEDDFPVIANP